MVLFQVKDLPVAIGACIIVGWNINSGCNVVWTIDTQTTKNVNY